MPSPSESKAAAAINVPHAPHEAPKRGQLSASRPRKCASTRASRALLAKAFAGRNACAPSRQRPGPLQAAIGPHEDLRGVAACHPQRRVECRSCHPGALSNQISIRPHEVQLHFTTIFFSRNSTSQPFWEDSRNTESDPRADQEQRHSYTSDVGPSSVDILSHNLSIVHQ
jgi:hypothetical protein